MSDADDDRAGIPTTEQLTAGLARGDARAVERFYRAYFDAMYAYAREAARGRDESFCLDVVQEAVLKVLRAVRPVPCERQFRAWLRLVVRATAYDLLRAEARRGKRELAAIAVAARSAGSVELADDAEQLRWLREQVATLAPDVVRMIELRYKRRWTLARVAEALGLTTGTVDGRLRRALTELRERAREAFDE